MGTTTSPDGLYIPDSGEVGALWDRTVAGNFQTIQDLVTALRASVPLTSKGDLLTRSGSGFVRLPAGADGYIVKALSSDANGILWVPWTHAIDDPTAHSGQLNHANLTNITPAANSSGEHMVKLGRINGASNYLTVPGVSKMNVTTLANPAKDTDRYSPFWVEDQVTIDAIVSEVTVVGTGNYRIGIYAATDDWMPTGAPIADTGDIAASAGPQVNTTALGAAVTLAPGKYLEVFNKGTANDTTFRELAGQPNGRQAIKPTVGGTPFPEFMTVTRTYAAFPATPSQPTGDSGANANGFGYVGWFRISAVP
jgi:hypothetical protein